MITVRNDPSKVFAEADAISLASFADWLEEATVPLGFQFDYREKSWTVIPGYKGTQKVQRSLENGKFMTLEFSLPEDSQDVIVQLVPVDGLVTTLERVLVGIGKLGQRRRSIRELSKVTGVSKSTTHKYVQRLRKLGLLYPRQGGYVDRDIWLTELGFTVLEALT